MEFSVLRARRGQASIEFILLILVMLLYLQALVQPSALLSADAATGTMGLGEARFAGEKIADAVNYVGSSSGLAKETIMVYVPKYTEVLFFKKNEAVEPYDKCEEKICVGYYLKIPGNQEYFMVGGEGADNCTETAVGNPDDPDNKYQYCIVPIGVFGDVAGKLSVGSQDSFISTDARDRLLKCTVEKTESGEITLGCV